MGGSMEEIQEYIAYINQYIQDLREKMKGVINERKDWKLWSILLNDWITSENFEDRAIPCLLKFNELGEEECFSEEFIPERNPKWELFFLEEGDDKNKEQIKLLLSEIWQSEIETLMMRDTEASNFFIQRYPEIKCESRKDIEEILKEHFLKKLLKFNLMPRNFLVSSLRFWSHRGETYGTRVAIINPERNSLRKQEIVQCVYGIHTYLEEMMKSKFSFTDFIARKLINAVKGSCICIAEKSNKQGSNIDIEEKKEGDKQIIRFTLPHLKEDSYEEIENFENECLKDSLFIDWDEVKSKCRDKKKVEVPHLNVEYKNLTFSVNECLRQKENEIINNWQIGLGIPSWKYIYFIPSIEYIRTYQGFGVWFLYFLSPLSPFWYKLMYKLFSIFLSKIAIIDWALNALRHSLRSAVAAIMARNMSHNIGSHVLAKASGSEDEIKKFHSYLRARMDFLADIPTGGSPIFLPTTLYADIMRNFKPSQDDDNKSKSTLTQKILLDRISAVKNIKSDKIEFIYKRDGGKISGCHNLFTKDTLFACPNGALGYQALYGILENIIRNTAKHANVNNIELTIKIEDNWELPKQEVEKLSETQRGKQETKNDLIKITIFDNAGNCVYNEEEAKANNTEKAGKIAIVEELNNSIQESIIDTQGKLKPGNWGIKEIKTCASYLRGLPPEEIDTSRIPPILKAAKMNDKGEIITSKNSLGNLGYEFYLLRLKRIFIVDGKFKNREWIPDKLNNLSSGGVDIRPSLEMEEVKRGIRHDFVLLLEPNEGILKEVEKYRYSLPIRIVRDDGKDIIAALNENKIEEVLITLWGKWIKELHGREESIKVIDIKETDNVTVFDQGDGIKKEQKLEGLPKQTQYIVYDYHLWHGADGKSDYLNKLNPLFREPYRAFHPIYPILTFTPEDPNSQKILAYELIEAGLISITIIDERIQEFLEDENLEWEGSKPREILNSMGVKVPLKKECDLDFKEIDDLEERKESIEDWIKGSSKGCLVMVIHQGILDRTGLSEPKDAEEWIQKMWSTYGIKHIIVDSGRGIPFNIPLNARFVHLSNLMRYTIEYKSKYHLVKLVFASRAKEGGKE